jgi:RNA polymerase-interacting CarD/CdnL/TRCF family regulator
MKDYGLEYRTLSSDWLSSPRKVELVWKLCEFTLHFVQDNAPKLDIIWEPIQEQVRKTINTSDIDSAKELLSQLEKTHKIPAALIKEIKAIASIKKEDNNFYSAWNIGT